MLFAEYATVNGNFKSNVKIILDQIPKSDGQKMIYSHENYLFHIWVSGDVVFLCIAEDKFGKRIPYVFLDDIRKNWKNTYGDKGKNDMEYAMQTEFSITLKKRMEYYSDEKSDRLREVNSKLNEVRETMVNSVEKLLERGQRIEILLEKSDHLNTESFRMKKKSHHLERVMWWKNTKLTIIIIAILVIIAFVIFLSVCRGFACFQPNPEPTTPSTTTMHTTKLLTSTEY